MNWRNINDWLQVVGTFGVVLSLIFVGVQMRQTQKIAAAEIYQARATLKVYNFALETSSPVMQEALRKAWAEEALSENETRNVGLFYYAWLSYWENNYYQHKVGMMSPEQWESSGRALRRFSDIPQFRVWWRETRQDWPNSFKRAVDEIVAEAEAAAAAEEAAKAQAAAEEQQAKQQ